MELVRPTDVPEPRIERTIGASRSACVLAFVASVASLYLVYHLAWDELVGWHWAVQTAVAPFVLIGLLLWLVVTHALWQATVGSFGSGNWIVKVGSEHLYLNLRCYANHHLPDVGPTVARIGYGEIASVGRVREDLGGDETRRVSDHLEIRLRHTQTTELRDAARAEARVEAPAQRVAFVSTRGRSTMRPVAVTAPGVIRVAWRGRRMLRALEGYVDAATPPRRVVLGDDDERGRGSDADDRILALVERGEHMAALELVQTAYEMRTTEAVRFLRDLEEAQAVGSGPAGPSGRGD